MPVENVEGVNYHGDGMETLTEPALCQEVTALASIALAKRF